MKEYDALYSGTGLDRREKVRRRVLHRAKRAVRKKPKDKTSSGSKSSSSKESSDFAEEVEDTLFDGESKIQRVAQRAPGALAWQALSTMRSNLLQEAGACCNALHAAAPTETGHRASGKRVVDIGNGCRLDVEIEASKSLGRSPSTNESSRSGTHGQSLVGDSALGSGAVRPAVHDRPRGVGVGAACSPQRGQDTFAGVLSRGTPKRRQERGQVQGRAERRAKEKEGKTRTSSARRRARRASEYSWRREFYELAFNKAVPDTVLPPELKGSTAYLASRVLPMGFLNSVSIAQNVHRNLVRLSTLEGEVVHQEEAELRKDRSFTVANPCWRVYLDSYDVLEKVEATGMVEVEGTVPEGILALRGEYERWDVPRNAKKAVERSGRCELEGATVDGLGVAL